MERFRSYFLTIRYKGETCAIQTRDDMRKATAAIDAAAAQQRREQYHKDLEKEREWNDKNARQSGANQAGREWTGQEAKCRLEMLGSIQYQFVEAIEIFLGCFLYASIGGYVPDLPDWVTAMLKKFLIRPLLCRMHPSDAKVDLYWLHKL